MSTLCKTIDTYTNFKMGTLDFNQHSIVWETKRETLSKKLLPGSNRKFQNQNHRVLNSSLDACSVLFGVRLVFFLSAILLCLCFDPFLPYLAINIAHMQIDLQFNKLHYGKMHKNVQHQFMCSCVLWFKLLESKMYGNLPLINW